MDATRREQSIGLLCLGVTAFGWALNWPLTKLLLQQWPPLFARGLAGRNGRSATWEAGAV
jgi:drug/metabolite transporter (DMT)-like permease